MPNWHSEFFVQFAYLHTLPMIIKLKTIDNIQKMREGAKWLN